MYGARRRGLKAGFMLVPLFGLQLLLTIYRPDVAVHGARHYEYITIAVTNSQASIRAEFHSLPLLCFLNYSAPDSRVVSMLDSGAEGPGFKSQPQRFQVTVLGKLFTPIVPLFTKQQNW